MAQKLNNNRKFPVATRQPCQDDKFRKDEAKERQAYYDTLTPQQKLAALDSRLGAGVGAVRQRTRLLLAVSKGPQPTKNESVSSNQ